MAKEIDIQAKLAMPWQFQVEDDFAHHVTFDVDEQSGGQNAGFRPTTMLLAALAGCMGTSVLSILRKKQQNVTAYEIRVHGVRSEEPPMLLTEITLEHIVTGHAIQPEAIRRSIELAETKHSGVYAMLSKAAHITNTFHLIPAT